MTTCVLRYRAPADVDIDVVVASLAFDTTAVFRRGTPRHSSSQRMHEHSGFNAEVSEHETFDAQLSDARTFLERHRRDLRQLPRPANQDLSLDFGQAMSSSSLSLSRRWPPDFLKLCADLGIALEMSVYCVSDEAD
jgi:hypothetical protein